MHRVVLGLLFVLLTVSSSWAQGVVEGLVRDRTGSQMPGVAVEAVSVPGGAAGTATTDARGRYRIEGLSPGTYTLTFRLAGFRTETVSVELPTARNAVVDAQMSTLPVQETVTIIDYPPPVDVRTATRTQELFEETILTIPNRRNYNSLLVVVPGVTTERNDIVVDPLATAFPFHAGRANEGRLLVDGLSVGAAPLGGSPAEYLVDITNALEVSFTTHAVSNAGGLGEVETGGLVMSVVPRSGGNRLGGSVSFAGNSAGMQGDNVSQELRSFGFATVPPVQKAWEAGGAVGGPIVRDRAWFFVSGRRQSLTRAIPGLFFNQNAGNASTFQYAPDLTRPAYSDRTWENVGGRLTLQASPKHRFSLFADEQAICRSCTGATSVSGFPVSSVSPEAQGVGDYPAQRVQQVSWTSPASRRLLLDARFGRTAYTWGNSERDGNNRSLVRVTGTPPFGGSAITSRSQDWADNHTALNTWHASAALVTGSHSFKAGHQGLFATDDRTWHTNDQNLVYGLSNGRGSQLTQVIAPFTTLARVAQASAYVQDAWTADRLTLLGAVRFDRARSWFPEQQVAPTRFLPAGLVFPKTTGVDAYTDVTPRMGAAYDLTGDGSTALRISAGKYLEGAGTTGVYVDSNPAARLVRTTTRGWSDFDFNFVPNCVLENSTANGECGSINSTFFGQLAGPTVDPSLLGGRGVRPSDWSLAASVERQFLPHASVAVEYFRRWYDGFTVVDNVLVGPADFQVVNVTVPQNPTLPASGQTIGPLYIQNQASFTRFQPVVMPADRYGNPSLHSDSLDVVIDGHIGSRMWFQGGSSTTWTKADNCDVRAAVPESAPLNPYCSLSSGALPQFRGLATYLIPRVGVQLGAVYQNKPGPLVTAAGSVFAGVFPFGFLSVNLVEPGTLYGERVSQLDLRAVKDVRIGRLRVLAGIDLYNAFNSSDALTYTQTYSSFLADRPVFPTSIMSPRLLRVTADVRF